jgi:hypothetical protein
MGRTGYSTQSDPIRMLVQVMHTSGISVRCSSCRSTGCASRDRDGAAPAGGRTEGAAKVGSLACHHPASRRSTASVCWPGPSFCLAVWCPAVFGFGRWATGLGRWAALWAEWPDDRDDRHRAG